MSSIDLKNLLDQYLTETISKEDYRLLWETLNDAEYAEQWHALAADLWDNEGLHPIIDPQKQVVFERLKTIVAEEKNSRNPPAIVHRVHFLRKWGWRAASIILLLGAGAYLWTANKKNKKSTGTVAINQDVLPGKNGAILTLADGSSILLDSVQDGVLALQGGAIAKVVNGALLYEGNGTEVVYNTVSTPKGRLFHLTLSDGTKVWLNSESSIRYPAFFAGGDRKVEITGEAYFEVAKNKQAPFRLTIDKKVEVDVLGTEFNINGYENEKTINTTLIEGLVRVIAMPGTTETAMVAKNGHRKEGKGVQPEDGLSGGGPAVTLKPGQQVRVTGDRLHVIDNADIEKVTAWKTGLFNFEDASLEEVMRQLERWYDIEVVYAKDVPDIRFFGKVSRNLTLADLLEALEESKVSFRMEEGRRLVVLP